MLILLSCTLVGPTTPYPGSAALLPVLGTALVIGAGCADGRFGAGRLLARSPMRAIGRVSYSWYLWHWPVLLLAAPLLGHPLGLAGRLVAAGVSGALAVLTLHLVENPLRFAAPIRRSPARSLVLGGWPPRSRPASAWCCWWRCPPGRARRAGHGAGHHRRTRPGGPHRYHTAVQHAFAQVQAALAASADLTAVPSNLNPPSPTPPPNSSRCCSVTVCVMFSKSTSLCARRVIPPRRRRWPWSVTRTPRCGLPRSNRSPPSGTGGWKPWPRWPAHR
ncbi:putative acyltransferase domain protein [Mycobacterium xenopi 4042]|uniref:Putative acyltransferase domain protein n=1 Tax=Mycobacterium xenopi 4042 TaxID=1299334 RepID=X8CL72_MYCXE|nr:putative acyltransferase domain protein [Mycobacterium xenopi 4042]